MTWYANKRVDGPTSVYVIECAGRTKIGLAVDVSKRRATLQLACPLPLAAVGSITFDSFRQARFIELELHKQFASARLHGEWFEASAPAVMAALERFREMEFQPPEPAPEAPKPDRRDWTEAEHQMARSLEF